LERKKMIAAKRACQVASGLVVIAAGQHAKGGPLTGACCSAGGNCAVMTAQACAEAFGAYQGDGVTCTEVDCLARCEPICEFCWLGTLFEQNCDPIWEGDAYCDCGCQFNDPDCGPRGACCVPRDGYCDVLTEATCRFYFVGVFNAVGVECAQAECNRCDPGCVWCWTDTGAEHACSPDWSGDLECDCACQFSDPDCGANVCGNLICEETAGSCPADCKDLRAFAAFQNCFNPSQPSPQSCAANSYADPVGIGLEDFGLFFDFWSGP